MVEFHTDAYREKISFAQDFVKKNLDITVEELINDRDWKEDSTLCTHLVNNCLSEEDFKYINNQLGNLSHLRDRRSAPEYALDLVVGWIIEDGIVEILKELGFNIILASADSQREFLKRPEATPDIKIKNDKNKIIRIEIVKDFTGYWRKNNKIDLRDSKYENLKKDNGILLGFDFKNNLFFLLPVENASASYTKSHWPYGGKPAYTISLKNVNFYQFDYMKREIIKIFD